MFLSGGITRNNRGYLEMGGCDLVGLAGEYGTPLYVYNEELIRKRCREYLSSLKKYYPQGEIAYAGKAFLTGAMCRLVAEEDLSLDVVSGGELYTALQAGFDPGRIYFHGNNKTPGEVEMALEAGVGRIVVDSLMELDFVDEAARAKNKRAKILLRIKPGVLADTHKYIQTGQSNSKFGLGIEDGQAITGVRQALRLPHLDLCGIHCHIGSQILDDQPYRQAVRLMVDFLEEVRATAGIILQELNLGGGLGISYTSEDRTVCIQDYVRKVSEEVRGCCRNHGLPLPWLIFEPGRSITAEAGATLYTVGTIKEVPGFSTYVSVDGGMMDNLRPALYDARYEAALANRTDGRGEIPVTIAGKACETGDILIRDYRLPLPRRGDTLVVFNTGAYHFSMFSQYNRNPRPAVVFVQNGQSRLIVKRETYEDIVRLDI